MVPQRSRPPSLEAVAVQHILNRWIRYVESTGNEVGMTLLVGGTTISGISRM